MMARKSTHVVPNSGKSGWDIRQSNAQRSSGFFNNKADAVNRAREISRNQQSELVIHNRNGRISQSDSHGNDPNPPKDKK